MSYSEKQLKSLMMQEHKKYFARKQARYNLMKTLFRLNIVDQNYISTQYYQAILRAKV